VDEDHAMMIGYENRLQCRQRAFSRRITLRLTDERPSTHSQSISQHHHFKIIQPGDSICYSRILDIPPANWEFSVVEALK
jgi:hypothetical protein